MSMFNSDWNCKYDELITFYPRFYRDVFEMDAILRAAGGLADDIQDGIEQVLLNNFVDGANEEALALFEAFLGLSVSKSRTIAERRRLIKSYFAGLGKMSATRIAEMIRAYTGAETSCTFEPFDEEKNNRLDIYFDRGDEETLYVSDIYALLARMLPAHIYYKLILQYTFQRQLYVGGTICKFKEIGLDSGITVIVENGDLSVLNYEATYLDGDLTIAGIDAHVNLENMVFTRSREG